MPRGGRVHASKGAGGSGDNGAAKNGGYGEFPAGMSVPSLTREERERLGFGENGFFGEGGAGYSGPAGSSTTTNTVPVEEERSLIERVLDFVTPGGVVTSLANELLGTNIPTVSDVISDITGSLEATPVHGLAPNPADAESGIPDTRSPSGEVAHNSINGAMPHGDGGPDKVAQIDEAIRNAIASNSPAQGGGGSTFDTSVPGAARLAQFNTTFGDNFGSTLFDASAFSDALQNIVDDEQQSASNFLANAQARGRLSDTGIRIGNEALGNQRQGVEDRISEIGSGIRSDFSSGIDEIVGRARADATNPDKFGDLFDPQPFIDEARTYATDRAGSFEQDVRDLLGVEQLFDPQGALNEAGAGQGLVPGNPALLDTLAAREADTRRKKERGLGTRGAF